MKRKKICVYFSTCDSVLDPVFVFVYCFPSKNFWEKVDRPHYSTCFQFCPLVCLLFWFSARFCCHPYFFWCQLSAFGCFPKGKWEFLCTPCPLLFSFALSFYLEKHTSSWPLPSVSQCEAHPLPSRPPSTLHWHEIKLGLITTHFPFGFWRLAFTVWDSEQFMPQTLEIYSSQPHSIPSKQASFSVNTGWNHPFTSHVLFYQFLDLQIWHFSATLYSIPCNFGWTSGRTF